MGALRGDTVSPVSLRRFSLAAKSLARARVASVVPIGVVTLSIVDE